MQAIEGQVTDLVGYILDPTDLAATTLDDRLRARCAAAIVLAHAEIEEAIERACEVTVDALVEYGPPGFAFLAWGLSSTQSAKAHEKSGGSIAHLAKEYRSVIKSTNGIKRENLRNLLIPLGIDLRALEADIANLDSFGAERGDVAHLSPLKAKMQKAPSAVQTTAINAARSASVVISAIQGVTSAVVAGIPPPKVSAWKGIFRGLRHFR